jgi:hypothetical protein
MKKILLILVCCSCEVKTVETNSALTEVGDTLRAGFDENNYESFLDLENYMVGEEPDAAEQILTVDSTAVVIVNPTDAQRKEMEEKYGEDFHTIADDASFYQSEAMVRLDSAQIRQISLPSEQRYVRLKGIASSWLLDLRKEGAPEWNVIFFDIRKEPEIVSAIDVTTDRIKQFFAE